MNEDNVRYIVQALPFIGEGLLATVKVSVASFAVALVVAYVVGVLRANDPPRWVEWPLATYVELFRGRRCSSNCS